MRWGIRCQLTEHHRKFCEQYNFTYDVIDGVSECWYGGNANPVIYSDINLVNSDCNRLSNIPSNKRDVSYYYVKEYQGV